ncbi:MAG: MFS transporter [Spirochaetes bacterium]|nr:MFS transporter [Spirochaetota bacterium]MBU1081834.1 MFS transporter [Spirochaetota bacterium]
MNPANPARPTALGARNWAVLGLLGLSGQVAWNVENNWFNVFVYDEVTPDPGPIAIMVAVSAIVATLTALVMGAASDRVGKRRPFIAAGYVLWSASMIAYPMAAWAPSAAAAVFLVIALDAVMTFFGATANDAAFNAWATDITVPGNRGRVEALLNVMPVVAVVVGMGASGFLIDRFGYVPFFFALGGLVLATGLAGSALLRESPSLRPAEAGPGFWRSLVAIVSPAEIRSRKELYVVFIAMAVFSIGVQISNPYEIIYLNAYVGISKSMTGMITAMVGPVLVLFALPIGRLTDKGKGFPVAFGGFIVSALGQFLFSTTSSVALLTLFAVLKSVGFLMFIVLGAWHRDLVPEGSRGAYQGVRLFFAVLVPMVIGPAVGSAIIKALGSPITSNGQAGFVPPPAIYWVSAAVILASVAPVWALYRLRKGKAL